MSGLAPKLVSSQGNEIVFTGDFAPTETGFWFSNELNTFLHAAGTVCLNFEGAVTRQPIRSDKTGAALNLSTDLLPTFSEALLLAGLNNNHTMDFGSEGLSETMEFFRLNNISCFGAGKDRREALQPLIVNLGSKRVGVIGFCMPDLELVFANEQGAGVVAPFGQWNYVKKLKQMVDHLIVTCHGGIEFIDQPAPSIVRLFRKFIESGADAVIGHHPHVPQGWESYRGGRIFYSLGNFVFNHPYHSKFRNTDMGYLVRCRFGMGIDYDVIPVKRAGTTIEARPDLAAQLPGLRLHEGGIDHSEWRKQCFEWLFPSWSPTSSISIGEGQTDKQPPAGNKIRRLGKSIVRKMRHIFLLLSLPVYRDIVIGAALYGWKRLWKN